MKKVSSFGGKAPSITVSTCHAKAFVDTYNNGKVSSGAELAYPEVWRIWKSAEPMNWVAFGPNGYYIVDTVKNIYASRSNDILRTKNESGKYVPLRCASFGYDRSWVVVEDDGVIRSHGLASNIRRAMLQGNVRVSAQILSSICFKLIGLFDGSLEHSAQSG